MELAVTKLAIICFFITGVSHIAQPRLWAQFFIELRRKGTLGSFYNAMLHLPTGVVIVSFHDVWDGIPIVLTLIGWGLVIKSFVYLVFPQLGTRMLSKVTLERSRGFVIAGILLVAVSGLLTFDVLRRTSGV